MSELKPTDLAQNTEEIKARIAKSLKVTKEQHDKLKIMCKYEGKGEQPFLRSLIDKTYKANLDELTLFIKNQRSEK